MSDNKPKANTRLTAAVGPAPLHPQLTAKLELLEHLLGNQQKPLLILGPTGIGKTTLLQALLHDRRDTWHLLPYQGSETFTFSTIISELGEFLSSDAGLGNIQPTQLRRFFDTEKTVLIIDDAEAVPPEEMDKLLEFCASLPALGLVATMTYDGFHVKRSTDQTIDDCHVIELLPLDRKELTEFLRNLCARPDHGLNFDADNDTLVNELYLSSHGIPGRALAALPGIRSASEARLTGRASRILAGVLIAACLAWGWFLLNPMPSGNQAADIGGNQHTVAQVAIPSQPAAAPTPPAASLPQAQSSANRPPEPDENTAATTQPDQPAIQAPPEHAATAGTQATTTPAGDQDTVKTPGKADDRAWIMAQPADNYTLQVVAVDDMARVQQILKKYADYRDNLKYYATGAQHNEKFVIIYGSFQTLAQARKQMVKLPAGFGKCTEVRFQSIQHENH